MRFHHFPVFHYTAVAHTHGGTHGNDPAGRVHGGPDNPVKGVFVQHAVHVRTHEELVGNYVHAGVGSIGLGSAVHLVHHRKALEGRIVALGLVQATEGLGLDFLHIRIGHLDQVEILDEQVQRPVLGTVVHNYHLKVRIVQAQQGLHIGDNRLLLIVGRGHNGHARSVRRLLELVYGIGVVVIGVMLPVLHVGQHGHGHVTQKHRGGIHYHEIVEEVVNPLRHIGCCLSNHTLYGRSRAGTPPPSSLSAGKTLPFPGGRSCK